MKVRECMTRDVVIADSGDSIRDAARKMAECDAGSLPVGEEDKLVGMITDRDIVLRAVAKGLGPDTPVRQVMSQEVLFCFENDDMGHVADIMADQQIRRLPVIDRDKHLVGIVSVADLAKGAPASKTGEAVAGISRRGGKHDQTLH